MRSLSKKHLYILGVLGLILLAYFSFKIIHRIEVENRKAPAVVVTIPEGFSAAQIASAAAGKLKYFDKTAFLAEARGLEGRLFPDTYFFVPTTNDKEAAVAMLENFQKKIAPLRPEIAASGKSEKDILVMASLIEREAKGEADRAIISGILWKRISIGMALQVDAAPETYKTRGLPANPIDNPGLAAIKAAVFPQNSPYLYYLHDQQGGIHYAKTFAEHRANIKKYFPPKADQPRAEK